ncbi:MAG: WD40 repeat domain-containing protein [Gemmataceae bacterium]|nr:WD40 repeat domain-containing protein [Gemmataceae bacterium]
MARRLRVLAWGTLLVLLGLDRVPWHREELKASHRPSAVARADVPMAPRLDRYGDPLPAGSLDRLGAARLAHPDVVTSVALSSDQRIIASTASGIVWLWDSASGKLLRQLGDTDRGMRTIAFSPDGRAIAAAHSGEVVFWDVSKGTELGSAKLAPGNGGSPILAFAADGNTIAVPCGDERNAGQAMFVLLQVPTGKVVRRFPGHKSAVKALAYSPCGKVLASGYNRHGTFGGSENVVRLWDAATGKTLHELPAGTAASLAFSPDGKSLAVAGGASTVSVWEVATGKTLYSVGDPDPGAQENGRYLAYQSVAFSSDGKSLFISPSKGGVIAYETATRKERQRFKSGEHAMARDGQLLVRIDGYRILRWRMAAGKAIPLTEGSADAAHHGAVFPLSFSADGKSLLTCDTMSRVLHWDIHAKGAPRQVADNREAGRWDTFSSDGKLLCRWNEADKTAHLRDVATMKELRPCEGDLKGGNTRFAFSADGRRLAGETYVDQKAPTKLSVWDTATGKRELYIDFRNPLALSYLAFSPDGSRIASAGAYEPLRVWDAVTGKLSWDAKTNFGGESSWSPDGKTIAIAEKEEICVRDVGKGEVSARLGRNLKSVTNIRFSPNGGMLAAVVEGKTIHIWDVATGRDRFQFHGHPGPISSLAFSADGKVLASGSQDATVLLWDTSDPRRQ